MDSLTNSIQLSTFSFELQIAAGAVLKAAKRLKITNIVGTEQVKSGGVNDFVTAWDTIGQKVITEEIKKHFPNDEILGEESDLYVENPTKKERLWVIDPIDGTANARAGRRYSIISLGFIQNGVHTAGIAYDPYHNDIYYAERGKGAYKNTKTIHVSHNIISQKASVNSDMGFINQVSDLHMELFKAFGSPTRRMMGSAIGEMLEVATGMADLFFYACIKPWDNAAVFTILEEAGAIVRGIDGRSIDFTSMDVLVGNGVLVADFAQRVGSIFRNQVAEVQELFLRENPNLSGIVSGINKI